ncbi:PAS domain S-box protein [Brevundimonas sp. TWP2-3-4b1]|uniref:PAS domain-containing hybrid sensor histidine kinase/response regulator n=1 Tax=Brevundimonas sp. TWP2-3-4b1 TaxID=2804580 RepID=UPI003CF47D99
MSGHVRWSEQVYRIHGVTPEAFDPNLDDAVGFYHPDDQQAVRDWCANAMETGEAGEFQLRLMRSDGEERAVISQCRPECGPDGTTIALYGVFQDVTERVQAEETIKASEARYRLLADNSTDIIATYGIDGVFRYLSPAIEGPMGYRPDEMVGQPAGDFMHPEDVDRVLAVFADYARSGPETPSPRVPYRGVRKDGSFVWLEAHPKVIRDAIGQPIEFQDVVRDITETKALEEALIEARDVAEAGARAKSEFLANMSHELRTPLTSVIGFSGLLKGSQSLPDAERRFADRIATSSEALLSVINDILDYSKLEADAVGLDPMPFDPKAMAEGAAGIVEAQCVAKGLALDIEVEPGLPEALMGDEGRLRQVMLNFLSNAVKFTGHGRVLLNMGWADGRLRIAVTDSGIGIAADKIDALFDRFTQADASTTRVYGGTGLGLAISRRLIELMGGEIGADSRPGHGSTFWLEVPLDAARTSATVEAQTLAEVPAGSRILMADDAAANRELVRAILGGWDIVLETFDDGAAAVQAAASGDYDLILMDVHMPVMDGLDATRAIRAMSGPVSRTPILALTANVQPEQVAACRAAGMDGHVGKPIQIRDLMATIANQLTASNVETSNVDAAA